MPFLEILNGPEVGVTVPIIHDTIFVGRDPNNHLVLTDRTVSRKHAVINQVEGRCVVTDLQSLKGLLVNGVKKTEATLEDGDEMTFGAVRVRYHQSEDAPQTEPKKNRKGLWFLVVLLLIGGGVAGGVYFLKNRPTDPLLSTSKEPNLPMLKQYYEEGISAYNRADYDAAQKAWEMVIQQDPKHKTLYGQKAAKLIKTLP